MYRLGIVDEHKSDRNEFFRFFGEDFEPIDIELEDEIESTLNNIVKSDVDAVAIDYKLKEHNSSVLFNGNDLFNKLRDEMEGFPSFLMTAYADEAKKHNIDPFRIFSKELMAPDPNSEFYKEGRELIERIKYSIRNYEAELKDKEERLHELLEKAEKQDLDIKEEEELINLDNFFEKILDATSRIPEQLKKPKNEEKLDSLIDKADKIINRLDESE